MLTRLTLTGIQAELSRFLVPVRTISVTMKDVYEICWSKLPTYLNNPRVRERIRSRWTANSRRSILPCKFSGSFELKVLHHMLFGL